MPTFLQTGLEGLCILMLIGIFSVLHWLMRQEDQEMIPAHEYVLCVFCSWCLVGAVTVIASQFLATVPIEEVAQIAGIKLTALVMLVSAVTCLMFLIRGVHLFAKWTHRADVWWIFHARL